MALCPRILTRTKTRLSSKHVQLQMVLLVVNLLVFSFFLITNFQSRDICEYYVNSLNGNNSNDGTSAKSPFYTIEYTKDYIAKTYENSSTKCIVNLMNDGTFYLSKHLVFTSINSGTSESNNIVYKTYPHNSNKSSIISSGIEIPSSCWKLSQAHKTYIYQCNLVTFNLNNNYFRSISINNKRAIPIRYPKVSTTNYFNYPYTDNGWLFINSSQYIQHGQWIISVDSSSLIPSLYNGSFKHGNINIFPGNSWISLQIYDVKPYYNDSYSELTYFIVSCPDNRTCHGSKNNAPTNMKVHDRFYFYNISLNILQQMNEYEWYYENENKILYIALNYSLTQSNTVKVIIPQYDKIMQLNNVSNIEFNNIGFRDIDYSSYGYQAGFNIEPNNPQYGIPCDAAIWITNGSHNIHFTNNTFLELSGSGFIIGNNSNNILIMNNTFHHLGQSGILLVGNNSSQAYNIKIQNNTFLYLGEILASSAAIYISSSSNNLIEFNNMSYLSRWGIEIRSANSAAAQSSNNIFQYNIIIYSGLQTSDYGGISLSGANGLNNKILFNCIKNSQGKITEPNVTNPHIITPADSFGISMDNQASGYYIYGNILHTQVLCGINMHSGSGNWIQNNIYFNTSESPEIPSQWGQITMIDIENDNPFNNTVINNVIYYFNKNSVIISNKGGTFDPNAFANIDYNLYYNPYINISQINLALLTPAGNTWQDWLNSYDKRFDQHSIIDINPGFVDEYKGNFNLKNNSPLKKLGFKPIPSYIASTC
eukprot:522107_1